MKERLDHIKQRRMSTCEGRIKIEVTWFSIHGRHAWMSRDRRDVGATLAVALHPQISYTLKRLAIALPSVLLAVALQRLLEKDIAKVSVSMPDHGCSRPCRVERPLSPFNQLPQRSFVGYAVNNPAVTQQRVAGKAAFARLRACRKADMFARVKAFEAAACQTVPEQLVDRCASMLLLSAERERRAVNFQQSLTLALLGQGKRLERHITCIACLNCSHQVEHDGPAHHRVDNHLLTFFV